MNKGRAANVPPRGLSGPPLRSHSIGISVDQIIGSARAAFSKRGGRSPGSARLAMLLPSFFATGAF